MFTLATFSKAEEAHLLRSRLESAGIPAFVLDENLVQMDWLYSNAIGGVRVQVADEDVGDAQAFLAADSPEITSPGLGVACPQCGSEETAPIEWPRRLAFLAILLMGLPLLLARHRWHCRSCRHTWTLKTRSPSILAVIFPSFLAVTFLMAAGGAVILLANAMLNDLLALFAVFGILIFLCVGWGGRRSETPSDGG